MNSEEVKIPGAAAPGIFGDPAGIRTPDTLLKRQVLCLLSYWVILKSMYLVPSYLTQNL